MGHPRDEYLEIAFGRSSPDLAPFDVLDDAVRTLAVMIADSVAEFGAPRPEVVDRYKELRRLHKRSIEASIDALMRKRAEKAGGV